MAITPDDVQARAPHMFDLVKKTKFTLEKQGLDPSIYKAAVVATLDHSYSTEDGRNRLYSDGTMQKVADLAFAAGLAFDDDGAVPFSLFSSRVKPLGDMTLSNCHGFVAQGRRGADMSNTDYVAALRWIIKEAGFGNVDLQSGRRGFLRRSSASTELKVRETAPYPTYALFVTDGEPNRGTQQEIEELLTLMSQLPIFVQFIGVGRHDFQFLERLDTFDGRLIDNANFFPATDAGNSQDKFLELMLEEFAKKYYPKAREIGLVTT